MDWSVSRRRYLGSGVGFFERELYGSHRIVGGPGNRPRLAADGNGDLNRLRSAGGIIRLPLWIVELAKEFVADIFPFQPQLFKLAIHEAVHLLGAAEENGVGLSRGIFLDQFSRDKSMFISIPLPIINKELPREEFDRLLAENPLNDRLLRLVEDVSPAVEAVEPDIPRRIGRIDFLGTNRAVGESVEYTDAEQFVAAIKDENHVGTPMSIVLYRDSEGQTIPQDFVAELDPPPQGFEVIDYAQAQMDRTKRLINEYCIEVFEQEADFSDLHHIDLAFGSTSDSGHTVEVSADLIGYRLIYQVDGEAAASIQCHDMDDLTGFLTNLDFDEMIAFAEDE